MYPKCTTTRPSCLWWNSFIKIESITGLLLFKHLMPHPLVHVKGTILIRPQQIPNKIMWLAPQQTQIKFISSPTLVTLSPSALSIWSLKIWECYIHFLLIAIDRPLLQACVLLPYKPWYLELQNWNTYTETRLASPLERLCQHNTLAWIGKYLQIRQTICVVP